MKGGQYFAHARVVSAKDTLRRLPRKMALRVLPDEQRQFDTFDSVELPVEGKAIARLVGEGGNLAGEILQSPPEHLDPPQSAAAVAHGSVAIADLTSCTNTSNPSVMIAPPTSGIGRGDTRLLEQTRPL